MKRNWVASVFVFGALFGCGDGEGEGGPHAKLWAGSWAGSVRCQGFYEDSNGRQPYQGETELEARFDKNGYLLYEVGGKMVPQKQEGQLDQWVPSGGGVAKRLLARFDDNGEQRYYRFEESFEESTESGGSFTRNTQEDYDLQVDGDTLRGTYELAIHSVSLFVSEFGSGRSESQERASCEGELKRK